MKMFAVNSPASVKRKTTAPLSSQKRKLRSTKSLGFVVENVPHKISPTSFASEKKVEKTGKSVGSRKSALKKSSVNINESENKENKTVKRKVTKRVTIVEELKNDEDSDSPYSTRSGRVRLPIRNTPRKSNLLQPITDNIQTSEESDEDKIPIKSPFKKLVYSSSEEDTEDLDTKSTVTLNKQKNAEDVVATTGDKSNELQKTEDVATEMIVKTIEHEKAEDVATETIDKTRKRKRSTFELEETVTGREKLKRHSEKFIPNTPKLDISGTSKTTTPNKRLTFELEESIVLKSAKKKNKSVQFIADNPVKTPRLDRSSTFTKDEVTTVVSKSVRNGTGDTSKLERSNTFTTEDSFSICDMSNVTTRRKANNSSLKESFLNLDDQSMPEMDFSLQTSSNEESVSPQKNLTQSYKNKVATPKFKNLERFRISTPLSAKKLPAARNTSLITKEKKCSFNGSSSEMSTSIKRTKLPDFAKIHKKALDKTEDILEMTQRKEQRAKLLLSGRKPPTSTSMRKKSPKKSSPVKEGLSKTSKKQLDFNKQAVVQRKMPVESKIPSRKGAVPLVTTKKDLKIDVGENGTTRFGFKQKQPVSREHLVKAVVNKSKIQENSLESRRNVIKGVRSNRRFELLMSMRNK